MRFLQQDTELGDIKNPATRNLYAYAGGDPLNYTDPSGHWAYSIQNGLCFATVEKGDTLSGLSQYMLGSASKWKQIGYKGNPENLKIGTKINVTEIFKQNDYNFKNQKPNVSANSLGKNKDGLNNGIRKPGGYDPGSTKIVDNKVTSKTNSELSFFDKVANWFTNDPSAIAGSYGYINRVGPNSKEASQFIKDNFKEFMFGGYSSEKMEEARVSLFRQGILKSDPYYDILLESQMEYWKEYDKPTWSKALATAAGIGFAEAVRRIIVSRILARIDSRSVANPYGLLEKNGIPTTWSLEERAAIKSAGIQNSMTLRFHRLLMTGKLKDFIC